MTKTEKKESVPPPGVGLDVGTMNFVSARNSSNDKVITSRVRNAFIDLPSEHKRMLKLSKTAFAEVDGKLLVIGDEALSTANLLNREARRPMSGGVIAASEIDAQRVIGIMMNSILGDPRVKGEKCSYSVPAAAVDVAGSNIIYHEKILGKILTELGFKPEPVNEAMAIVFSNCANTSFSALSFSFGSGMTNVCLAYNALSALEFSLGRGGDWIDAGASTAVGTTSAKICSIKESGVDITKPNNREEEAISFYIENLIEYTISNVVEHFSKAKSEILLPKEIPIVVSGGTSLATGFLDKFKNVFNSKKSNFPIKISDIVAASDPLTAVATGLLVMSQMDDLGITSL